MFCISAAAASGSASRKMLTPPSSVSIVNGTCLHCVRPINRQIELNPGRWRGLEAYRWEQRTLAVGDRLQFRAPDKVAQSG